MKKEFGIDKYLFYFKEFIKKNQKVINKYLKEYNITYGHLEYIKLLRMNDAGYTMTELSKHACIDKSFTTRIIRDLEKKSYVYRDTDNPNSRNYNIRLTEKGKDMTSNIEAAMKKRKAFFMSEFTEEEKEQLISTLEMLMRKLEKEESE